MSFQASLQEAEYQVLWTRSICSLAKISDTVRFTINKQNVVISSVNSTNTSLFSVSFNSQKFFKEFTLSEELSILVHSKPLALIFKNYRLGNEEVEFFRFTVNETSDVTRINRARNKLFIEIMARDNLKKNYSLNFVKCKDSFNLQIDKKYKDLLLSQSNDYQDAERIHYLMVETSILRNFLDMFPPAIEDFKIEVVPISRRLNLIGFNKQQLLSTLKGSKESLALRQPMSLTVGISLNDIMGDNFPIDEQENRDRMNMVFRLKDFKTFVNLISSINLPGILQTHTSGVQFDKPAMQSTSAIETLFNKLGLPILFSTRYELPNTYADKQVTNTVENVNEEFELFKIELILISDSEGDNINIQDKDLVIPNIEILRTDVDSDNKKREFESLFVENDENAVPLPRNDLPQSKRRFQLQILQNGQDPQSNGDIGASNGPLVDQHQSVAWNTDEVVSEYIRNQTSEFVQLNRDSNEFVSHDTNEQELTESEQFLGPTQNVYKVKGLFD